MLEYVETRKDPSTNKRLDQFGHVMQRGTQRPPYVWPDLLREAKKKETRDTYLSQLGELWTIRERIKELQKTMDDDASCGEAGFV